MIASSTLLIKDSKSEFFEFGNISIFISAYIFTFFTFFLIKTVQNQIYFETLAKEQRHTKGGTMPHSHKFS